MEFSISNHSDLCIITNIVHKLEVLEFCFVSNGWGDGEYCRVC